MIRHGLAGGKENGPDAIGCRSISGARYAFPYDDGIVVAFLKLHCYFFPSLSSADVFPCVLNIRQRGNHSNRLFSITVGLPNEQRPAVPAHFNLPYLRTMPVSSVGMDNIDHNLSAYTLRPFLKECGHTSDRLGTASFGGGSDPPAHARNLGR